MNRPAFVTEEHLEYLDSLREAGQVHMFGARPYVSKEFPDLTEEQSGEVLYYWCSTYAERHFPERGYA